MKCPYCGEENPEEARFCGNCGRKLSSGEENVKKPREKQKKRRYAKGIMAAAIAAAALFVALFLAMRGRFSVTLSNFSADEIYWLAGEESTITFTVEADGNTDSIYLCGSSGILGEMLDDGEDGDEVAGDGIYTLSVTLTEDESITEEYYAQSGRRKSESEEIRYFDTPTDSDWEALTQINAQAEAICSEYQDANGYVSDVLVEDALDALQDYAEELYTEGTVIWYERNDANIAIKTCSGITSFFEIPMEGYDSTGTSTAVSISTLQPCYSTYEGPNLLTDQAASDLAENFVKYSFEETNNYDDAEVTLEVIRSFSSHQVILWHGHGGYSKTVHSYLVTGEDYAWYQEWSLDYIQDRISVSAGGKICITSKYIDKYCTDLEGSYVYLAACSSAEDDVLARAFLEHGAAVVFGTSGSINTDYDIIMQSEIVGLMTLIINNTFDYYTAAEALEEAQEIHGETDANGTYVLIIGNFDYRFAQTASLSGQVTSDTEEADPIAGATIEIYQGDDLLATLSTDEDGNYETRLPLGHVTLIYSAEGYESEAWEINVEEDSSEIRDVSLWPEENDETENLSLSESAADQVIASYIEEKYGFSDDILLATYTASVTADGTAVDSKTLSLESGEDGVLWYKVLDEDEELTEVLCILLEAEEDTIAVKFVHFYLDDRYITVKSYTYHDLAELHSRSRCYCFLKDDYLVVVEASDRCEGLYDGEYYLAREVEETDPSLSSSDYYYEESICVYCLDEDHSTILKARKKLTPPNPDETMVCTLSYNGENWAYASGFSQYFSVVGATLLSTMQEYCDYVNEALRDLSVDEIIISQTSWQNRWYGTEVDESLIGENMVKVDLTCTPGVSDGNGTVRSEVTVTVNATESEAADLTEEESDDPVSYEKATVENEMTDDSP